MKDTQDPVLMGACNLHAACRSPPKSSAMFLVQVHPCCVFWRTSESSYNKCRRIGGREHTSIEGLMTEAFVWFVCQSIISLVAGCRQYALETTMEGFGECPFISSWCQQQTRSLSVQAAFSGQLRQAQEAFEGAHCHLVASRVNICWCRLHSAGSCDKHGRLWRMRARGWMGFRSRWTT